MNTMIEIYDRIMGVVEEVTGISKDKILTSNCEECVDARHILVYILKWIGDDKDKYLVACYDLALTDLKDKDRPYWIRKYFHVESKF